ncbi:MAG: response regulator transcription factor [Acidobacteria bacterium]|nr:response regulator transcription factor [Acidobacteriota bacterium]
MRLIIADDHALFRDSLRSLIEARGIEVLGEASNGHEVLDLAHRVRPDLVLMDLRMPEMDGLEATRRLQEELPAIKVVALTASTDDEDLFEALKAGAQGYLVKDLEAETFFHLLEAADRGEPALTPNMAAKMLREFARKRRDPEDEDDSPAHRSSNTRRNPTELTDREKEVLDLMVEGTTSNRDLAAELGVSENTVKFHVRNILDKLHLHSRAQAVGFAVRHRLVDTGEFEKDH